MVTAKLLVPAGAPDQDNSGEWLPPVQPKLLNTCDIGMVPPSLNAWLVTVKPPAACAAAWKTRAKPSKRELMMLRMRTPRRTAAVRVVDPDRGIYTAIPRRRKQRAG